MKCYNITLLAALLAPVTTLASDFEFCRQRTLIVFDLYSKVEQGVEVGILHQDPVGSKYPLEVEIVKQWWTDNLGDKMDLVLWHQKTCMKTRQGIKDSEKVML
jgi:hypothetical protein